MANWIRSFSCLSTNRIHSFSHLSTNRICSFSTFSSAMQDVKPQKIPTDSFTDRKPRKRNMKWLTSYSRMTQKAAFERLGFDLEKFARSAIPVRQMISEANCEIEGIGENAVKVIKENVYARMVEFIRLEGFPSEATIGFQEVNVNDLVLLMLIPIILGFQTETGRDLRLHREMELVSPDSQTGGYEEFVVVDRISTKQHSLVLIIESKRNVLGHAIRQCLLTMHDMFSLNGEGKAYGFVTTGELWRMVSYDGITFQITDTFLAVPGRILEQKSLWIEEYSVVVDCLLIALRSGGIVMKGVVV
ncbi:hypothetical protein HOY82DRAFT_547712 [Tuber indicum]|nr:hypothetical protein HOY82DRAFT_547712 [Tuber indicum]